MSRRRTVQVKMRNKDAVTKSYMKDNVRFADVMNFCLYDGKQVIRPELLREMDSDIIVLPYAKRGRLSAVQKYRDLLKYLYGMTDGSRVYLILGIENQSRVHYAMPVRNMLYDAGQYADQVSRAAARHAERGEIPETDDEYLSGFFKNDKLVPVVTLVIHWSSKPWEGPRSLYDMFDETDPGILSHVPDYQINLISPCEMSEEDLEQFSSSLKQVFRFIKHSDDKRRLAEIVYADSAFTEMDRDSVELINEVTGAGIKMKKREEKINMCAGIQGMIDDAVEAEQKKMAAGIQGMIDDAVKAEQKKMAAGIQGMIDDAVEAEQKKMAAGIQGMIDDAVKAETTKREAGMIRNLMKSMSITADAAMDALGVSEERRSELRKLLV